MLKKNMVPERKKLRKATPKAFLWDSSFDIIWLVAEIIIEVFASKNQKIAKGANKIE